MYRFVLWLMPTVENLACVPGAALPEEEARALARDALVRRGREPDLAEVSAESASRPALAGDEVVDTGFYVFLPEAWRRADDQRRATLQIANVASTIVLGLLLVAGAVLAVVRMTRKGFDFRPGLASVGQKTITISFYGTCA